MAEIGFIAAIVQVADVGFRLSRKLHTFGKTVASADESIVFISKDIKHLCSILQTLERTLDKDRAAQLYSHNDISTAKTIVEECREIFFEMERDLSNKITRMGLDGSSSRRGVVALERLKWPFLKSKITLHWSRLDKLKSSLLLTLNVFIYARLLVERTEDPSTVNDQSLVVESVLHTTAGPSGKDESSRAALDRNENHDAADVSTNGYIPATLGLDAALTSTEAPNKGKGKQRSEVPEVDPAIATLENYSLPTQHLRTEVQAEEHKLGQDMRSRLKDDIIHAHRSETRHLRAFYGHTKLEEKMREVSWRLVEMAEEDIEPGGQSQMEQNVEHSSEAVHASSVGNGPQSLDSQPSDWSQEGVYQEHASDSAWSPDKIWPITRDRVHAFLTNSGIEIFLNGREDPWNHLGSGSRAETDEKPGAAEENGWLPFWTSGPSRLDSHRILRPLNPIKTYKQNDHTPRLPFVRSGTSMLVTEKSHVMETLALSQDLAALTDSTDTDTFVSARSVISKSVALDSHPLCPVEDEQDGPLVILGDEVHGDPEYGDPVRKDGERLGVASLIPPLGEMWMSY